MVAVNFRMSEAGRVELPLTGPTRWENVLKQCHDKAGVDPGGIIAVRDGKILTGDDLVADGDSVDVYPAISGG